MNIVCSTDHAYIPHMATMLRSLRDTNPCVDIQVYVLIDGVAGRDLSLIADFCKTLFGGVTLIQVPTKQLAGLPLSHHISLATYYRLLIPDLLPSSCERALFLDSDIIINGRLADLYNANLYGKTLGAVRSPDIGSSKARLGLAANEDYFNAGVLLMDLSMMRSDNLARFASDLMERSPEKIKWWDQDVLNLYYRDGWAVLPDCFNSLPCWWTNDQQERNGSEFTPSTRNHDKPAIIHFTGPGACKPWHIQCKHPWAYLYRQYRRQTPWKHYRLEGRESVLKMSSRQLRRVVGKLRRLGSIARVRS